MFVNSNDACTVPTKSPELLASYTDQLLKKSNKESDAESLEAALDQAVSLTMRFRTEPDVQMIIFSFIEDKDVFQKFYQKKLGSRLVQQLSASDDSESSMITKLREQCGFEYTTKLTRMFTGELYKDESRISLTRQT